MKERKKKENLMRVAFAVVRLVDGSSHNVTETSRPEADEGEEKTERVVIKQEVERVSLI